MCISNYLCHVAGERPKQVERLHESTQRRLKAYAIAIHIPVVLWAVTGYLIARRVFQLESDMAVAVSAFCAALIYLVERLVLATPKAWFVNLGRLLIGIVVAVLGASAVDLVVFDREVAQQLRAAGEARITREYDVALHAQRKEVERRKSDWDRGREAAACEANGTCGSRVRNVGPVYMELAREAARLRQDYDASQVKLDKLEVERRHALESWRSSPRALDEAGLLSRVEALHAYTVNNTAALVAWALFFVLVLAMELMVVLVKLVFGETVDDYLIRVREEVSHHRAASYLDGITSPDAGVRRLISSPA
jgi:hypothetical protein